MMIARMVQAAATVTVIVGTSLGVLDRPKGWSLPTALTLRSHRTRTFVNRHPTAVINPQKTRSTYLANIRVVKQA